MRVPHEPWNSRDHVQLVGDAPAAGDALIIGASKGCVSDPGGAVIIHRDAWPLPAPISAAQRIAGAISKPSLCDAAICYFAYLHPDTYISMHALRCKQAAPQCINPLGEGRKLAAGTVHCLCYRLPAAPAVGKLIAAECGKCASKGVPCDIDLPGARHPTHHLI